MLNPPPSAYRSTADLSLWLDNFGVEYQADGTTVTVPMGQVALPLLPFLFDPYSSDKVAPALRVFRPAPLGAVADFRMRTGIHRQRPLAVKLRTGGETVTVWP